MLIGDVIKSTGLTRKAIYFYEEKGLVYPHKDKETGIRIYSQNDVDKLIKILRLRELDMSLSSIHNIFENPEKTELILQKHTELLQSKLNEIVDSIGKLNTIMTNFPPNGDLEDFQNTADIVMSRKVESEMDYKFKGDVPINYVRRITMQLFEAFLDLPLDSTERWNSWYALLDKVEEICTEELIIACQTLFGDWDLECLYNDFHLRKELVYGYTKFTHEDYKIKADEIIESLKLLVLSEEERQKWVEYCESFLYPVLKISNKKLDIHIESLSSVYKLYQENFKKLVNNYLEPYMMSSDGIKLREQLSKVLGKTYAEDIEVLIFFDFYNNTININHLVK